MPTHWESSTRPLFVKTVVVNGSRHAILTQEDPLGHTFSQSNKLSRPNSPQGSSSSGDTCSQANDHDKRVTKRGKKHYPLDLQGCLVKLRVVLATQENRKAVNNWGKPTPGPANKKRKHYLNRHKSLESEPDTLQPAAKVVPIKTQHLNIEDSVTVANYFTEPRSFGKAVEGTERLSGYSQSSPWNKQYNSIDTCSTAPTLGMCADYDVPWNSVSSENYFTRPFYNRLSERVLQWLDLSARRSPKARDVEPNQKQEIKSNHLQVTKKLVYRQSSEDNSEEVRTDEDVETALSMELPKFSQELNRQHKIKSGVPAKQNYAALQPENFNSLLRIHSGKYAAQPKTEAIYPRRVKRRGHLTKQVRLEDSSDEDDLKCDERAYNIWDVIHQEHLRYNKKVPEHRMEFVGFTQRKNIASSLTGIGDGYSDKECKPQLHIFIPAIPQEVSDAETEGEL